MSTFPTGKTPTESSIAQQFTSPGTSYLLWLACLIGVSGLHRFYNKKPVSGTIWLCTFGLLGIGQFIDLFFIPNMVEHHNLKLRSRLGLLPGGVSVSQPTIQVVIPSDAITSNFATAASAAATAGPLTKNQLMLKLLRAAAARGGKLSVTQAVLDTELPFADVEALLQEMVRTGYVSVENHPETGVILYHFVEL